MKSGEIRILTVLRNYKEKGLGVRRLESKTSHKVVTLYLRGLLEKGYVDYDPNRKRGKKRIVKITRKALEELKLPMDLWALNEKFKELEFKDVEDITVFEQKLDLFERVLLNLIETCLDIDPKYAIELVDITKEAEALLLKKKLKPLKEYKEFLESI